MASKPFKWDEKDTASIKRSAIRAIAAFALMCIPVFMGAIDQNSQMGALVMMFATAFGQPVLKALQRYASDNSQLAADQQQQAPQSFQ